MKSASHNAALNAGDDRPLKHLRAADPVLAGLLDRLEDPASLLDTDVETARIEAYPALIRAIVGQQLSVAVARVMWTRLLDQFDGEPPSPAALLETDPETLRAAVGLSRAKAASLRSLAEHVLDGRLELHRIDELDDATAEAELTAVKGIGPWTSDMFLMFHLGRPDVLAAGDLGVRKAISLAYGMDGLPTAEEVIAIAEPWRPWRTVACRLLWASLD